MIKTISLTLICLFIFCPGITAQQEEDVEKLLQELETASEEAERAAERVEALKKEVVELLQTADQYGRALRSEESDEVRCLAEQRLAEYHQALRLEETRAMIRARERAKQCFQAAAEAEAMGRRERAVAFRAEASELLARVSEHEEEQDQARKIEEWEAALQETLVTAERLAEQGLEEEAALLYKKKDGLESELESYLAGKEAEALQREKQRLQALRFNVQAAEVQGDLEKAHALRMEIAELENHLMRVEAEQFHAEQITQCAQQVAMARQTGEALEAQQQYREAKLYYEQARQMERTLQEYQEQQARAEMQSILEQIGQLHARAEQALREGHLEEADDLRKKALDLETMIRQEEEQTRFTMEMERFQRRAAELLTAADSAENAGDLDRAEALCREREALEQQMQERMRVEERQQLEQVISVLQEQAAEAEAREHFEEAKRLYQEAEERRRSLDSDNGEVSHSRGEELLAEELERLCDEVRLLKLEIERLNRDRP